MDLYVILGLPHGAKESDIKRAYRRLARRFHPDINPGDRNAEARFREILEAYETLIDPARRSRYEAGQMAETPGERQTSGFEGFDFSARGSDHAVTFGDLFAEVLSERSPRPVARERGADLHQEILVTFEEAFLGASRLLTLTRRETCRTCAGSGIVRSGAAPCLVCQGAGRVRSVRGHMVFSRICGSCRGSGQQRPRACPPCGGLGQEVHTETMTVPIPPGVGDGDRVRVEGRGNAGLRGGVPGDLYVRVHVKPHDVFRRVGDDVHMTVGVAVHEAALGARIDLPVPDGAVRLKVPPGSQSGQHFRVRERGMPARDGRRGDLIVEVQIVLPKLLDERSKELLREFGRLNGTSVRERPDADRARADGDGKAQG
jgi:molecular chaperone DnaJ